MSREIPLTQGLVALVDDGDYAWLSGFNWHANRGRNRPTYAATWGGVGKPNQYMHRLIMAAPKGVPVDHANGDPLDNRRSNLRLCTVSQNCANRRPSASGTYRGVSQVRRCWKAMITVGGKRFTGGRGFPTAIQAARAYDALAAKHFGAFAVPNFPPGRDWLFPFEVVGPWPPAPRLEPCLEEGSDANSQP